MLSLGEYLQSWARERRRTVDAMARATGGTVADVQDWLVGRALPPRTARIALSELVRISPLALERIVAGRTQAEVAATSGMSPRSVSALEHGYATGSVELWLAAAEIYAIEPADLVAMMRVQGRLGRPPLR